MGVNHKTWNAHRWLAKTAASFGSNRTITSHAVGNSSQIGPHMLSSSSGNPRGVGGKGSNPRFIRVWNLTKDARNWRLFLGLGAGAKLWTTLDRALRHALRQLRLQDLSEEEWHDRPGLLNVQSALLRAPFERHLGD